MIAFFVSDVRKDKNHTLSQWSGDKSNSHRVKHFRWVLYLKLESYQVTKISHRVIKN